MSAYGKISRPASTVKLAVRSYVLPNDKTLTVFPVRRDTVPVEALAFLADVFNDVIEEGRTYPQLEPLTVDQFADYFFGALSSHVVRGGRSKLTACVQAADCFVGLLDESAPDSVVRAAKSSSDGGVNRDDGDVSIESVRSGRSWQEAVLGMFCTLCPPQRVNHVQGLGVELQLTQISGIDVKPNYPGRSSHNCNAGFVVPTIHRGLKIGMNLGKAYLYYAPLLGYRGSVFNLVYVSNTASLRIWDSLGFERAGLIPNAGRLKSKEKGGQDEYTDAVVYFKDLTA